MKIKKMYPYIKGSKVIITTRENGYRVIYDGDIKEIPYRIAERHIISIRLNENIAKKEFAIEFEVF